MHEVRAVAGPCRGLGTGGACAVSTGSMSQASEEECPGRPSCWCGLSIASLLQGGGVHGNAILTKFDVSEVAVVRHRWVSLT